jgi:hypothetical protein
MSRKKIKLTPRPKKNKHKDQEITLAKAAKEQLLIKRSERNTSDEHIVIELHNNNSLDLSNRSYKYLQSTAKTLGWTVGRLNKVMDRISYNKKAGKALMEKLNERETKQNQDRTTGRDSGIRHVQQQDSARGLHSIPGEEGQQSIQPDSQGSIGK